MGNYFCKLPTLLLIISAFNINGKENRDAEKRVSGVQESIDALGLSLTGTQPA